MGTPNKSKNGGPSKSQMAASIAAVPPFNAQDFLMSVGAGRSTKTYKAKKPSSGRANRPMQSSTFKKVMSGSRLYLRRAKRRLSLC